MAALIGGFDHRTLKFVKASCFAILFPLPLSVVGREI